MLANFVYSIDWICHNDADDEFTTLICALNTLRAVRGAAGGGGQVAGWGSCARRSTSAEGRD